MSTFTIRDQWGGKVGTVSWDANGNQPRAKVPAYVKIADVYEKAGGASQFLAKWDELVALHKPSKGDRASWQPVIDGWNAYVRSMRPAKPRLNGEQRRDRGIAQVSSGEDRQAWLERAAVTIHYLNPGSAVCACTLRNSGYPEPPHQNLWGALFSRSQREGTIRFEDYHQASTASRKAGVHRLYRRTGKP